MLRIDNISVDFEGLKALNDVSMEAGENEVTALIGPNGAGKTTLFNMIAGAKKPDSGHIFIDDTEITGLKPHEICKLGITRTYQVIKLFSKMSVLDNVLVGMHTKIDTNIIDDIFHTKKMKRKEKEAHKKAMGLLEIFGLEKYANIQAGFLSYGQQRLLEIARALGSDPKILLLDEPAAGMNDSEKKELDKKIKEIKKMGISIIIVEHDMSLVMNVADKIYVIEAGKNLACGTPDDIQKNQKVIDAYLGGSEQ